MSDSADDEPSEHTHRIIRGVWQPRKVDPKDRIDPFEPAPKGRLVQCFITTDPGTQIFYLFLQLSPQLSMTNQGKYLLSAAEISHLSRCEFSIWKNLDDMSEDSEFLAGKVLSNLSRTEYIVHDYRSCAVTEALAGCFRPHHGARPGSRRVAQVHYNMTLGKPQQFHCAVLNATVCAESGQCLLGPARNSNSHRICPDDSESNNDERGKSKPGSSEQQPPIGKSSSWGGQNQPKLEDTLEQSKSTPALAVTPPSAGKAHEDETLNLQTQAYAWDEKQKRYFARFEKRDAVSGSSKNFQLVVANPRAKLKDNILLQFGEISPELYFMDYRYPLSAFTSLGICLTRLD